MIRGKKSGFTLVEMLVVISIIATLAAMTAVATKTITEKRTIKLVEAQMRQIESAIVDYKAKLGFYPQDNGSPGNINWTAVSPLFYELTGTVPVLIGGIPTGDYRSVLGNDFITSIALANAFSRAGLANSSDQSRKNFFPSMLPFHFKEVLAGGEMVKLLVVPAVGPVKFSNSTEKEINPWRYNSSYPTNNIGSFDLWAELKFQNRTVIVGNWKRRQQ